MNYTFESPDFNSFTYSITLKPVKSGTINSGIISGTFTNLSPAPYPTGLTPRSETIKSRVEHSKIKTVNTVHMTVPNLSPANTNTHHGKALDPVPLLFAFL